MTVLQRVMAVVLAVLGAASLGLAIASATLWRPDDVVTASVAPSGEVTMLVAEPGVLGLVGDEVTVTAARADGGPVAIVVGREADVRGWVGDDAHVQVSGLASWTDLSSTPVAGETTPVPEPSADAKDADGKDGDAKDEAGGDEDAPSVGASGIVGPDPLGSDMWLAEARGDGTATLTLDQKLDREMLLVAGTGDGAVAPTVTMSWPRVVSTPALVPGVVLGVVLLLAAAALILVPRLPAIALRIVEARNARRGVPAPVRVAPDAPHGGPIVAPTSRFAASVGSDENAPAAAPAAAQTQQPAPVAAAVTAPAAQAGAPAPGELGGRPLTRRELRERAEREAAEAARDRGRKRPRTGMLPQVRSRAESATETAEQNLAAPGSAGRPATTQGPAAPGQAAPAAAVAGATPGSVRPTRTRAHAPTRGARPGASRPAAQPRLRRPPRSRRRPRSRPRQALPRTRPLRRLALRRLALRRPALRRRRPTARRTAARHRPEARRRPELRRRPAPRRRTAPPRRPQPGLRPLPGPVGRSLARHGPPSVRPPRAPRQGPRSRSRTTSCAKVRRRPPTRQERGRTRT